MKFKIMANQFKTLTRCSFLSRKTPLTTQDCLSISSSCCDCSRNTNNFLYSSRHLRPGQRLFSSSFQCQSRSPDYLKFAEDFTYTIRIPTLRKYWLDIEKPINFEIEYFDSKPKSPTALFQKDNPEGVILAIHDLTGSNTDLLPIILPLSKLGYRVIAPNLPGHGGTKFTEKQDKITYTGSTGERVVVLKDFLSLIGVEKVDCVVGLGFGCYSGIALASEHSEEKFVKSLALLFPMSHHLSKAHGHPKFFEVVSQVWDIFFLKALVFPVLTVMKMFYGYYHLTTLEFAMVMRALRNCSPEEVENDLHTISMRKIPISMAFNSCDKRVPESTSRDLVDVIGIEESNIVTVQKESYAKEDAGVFSTALHIEEMDSTSILDDYKSHIVYMIWDQLKQAKK